MSAYTVVFWFLLVGAVFPLVAIIANNILTPPNRYEEKLTTYECGELIDDDARINFNIRYYVFALTFFVFDVEAIFLYPWAIVFREIGLFAFVEMVIFLVVLAIGLFYAYRKRVLHWV